MLRQDLQFFDRPENNTGALASRLDENPQAILELMGFNVALIFISALNVLACSVLGIAHSWKLGLVVVLAGLPPMLAAGWLKIRFDVRLDRDVAARHAESSAIASEAVTAIRTVSSLAIEESVLRRYTEELDGAVRGSVRPLFAMMVWFALTQSLEYGFLALGFWCVLLPLPLCRSLMSPIHGRTNDRPNGTNHLTNPPLGTAVAWCRSTKSPCTSSSSHSWASSSPGRPPLRFSSSRPVSRDKIRSKPLLYS